MKKLAVLGVIALLPIVTNAKTVVNTSDFDGSVTIATTLGWTECPSSKSLCPLIGYAWGKSILDSASIVVEISDFYTQRYYNITSLRLNVDGNITSLNKFAPNQPTKFRYDNLVTYTQSTDYFEIPLSMLQDFSIAESIKM